MRLPYFQHHTPKSLNAALKLLEKIDGRGIIMAGGTELLNRMRLRLVEPEHIISLSMIRGLGNISINKNKEIDIGATAMLNYVAHFFEKVKPYKAIHEAAIQVASHQIRNMATIGGNILQDTRCMFYNRSRQWQKTVPPCHKRGGNICHAVKNSRRCFAVYQGDMAPVLIALKAVAVFYTSESTHEIPVEDIFSMDGKRPITVEGNRILASIRIPSPEEGLFSTYKKYRIRDGVDFPLAGVAIAIKREKDIIADLRICLTGVASRPFIIKDMGHVFYGKTLSPQLMEEIAHLAFENAHPVDNLEDSSKKRRLMVRQMVFDALLEADTCH